MTDQERQTLKAEIMAEVQAAILSALQLHVSGQPLVNGVVWLGPISYSSNTDVPVHGEFTVPKEYP